MSFFVKLTSVRRRSSYLEEALFGGDITFSFRPSLAISEVTTGKNSWQIDNLLASADTSPFFCNMCVNQQHSNKQLTFVHRL
jgi:hypothetical protein